MNQPVHDQPASNQPASNQSASEQPVCPVCPHPVESHDAVAHRFCAALAARATQGNARRCVCPANSAGATYANSTRNPISGRPAAGPGRGD